MWRTGPCDRLDPGTRNDAENSKLPRPSIKAPSDYAGSLRTLFPSRRLRLLKLTSLLVSDCQICRARPRVEHDLRVVFPRSSDGRTCNLANGGYHDNRWR